MASGSCIRNLEVIRSSFCIVCGMERKLQWSGVKARYEEEWTRAQKHRSWGLPDGDPENPSPTRR